MDNIWLVLISQYWVTGLFQKNGVIESVQIYYKNNEYFKKIALFLWVAVTTEKFGQHYFPYCLVVTALMVTLCY
jgi:hypothetical protein